MAVRAPCGAKNKIKQHMFVFNYCYKGLGLLAFSRLGLMHWRLLLLILR